MIHPRWSDRSFARTCYTLCVCTRIGLGSLLIIYHDSFVAYVLLAILSVMSLAFVHHKWLNHVEYWWSRLVQLGVIFMVLVCCLLVPYWDGALVLAGALVISHAAFGVYVSRRDNVFADPAVPLP